MPRQLEVVAFLGHLSRADTPRPFSSSSSWGNNDWHVSPLVCHVSCRSFPCWGLAIELWWRLPWICQCVAAQRFKEVSRANDYTPLRLWSSCWSQSAWQCDLFEDLLLWSFIFSSHHILLFIYVVKRSTDATASLIGLMKERNIYRNLFFRYWINVSWR